MRRTCQPFSFSWAVSFSSGCHASRGPESHVARPVARAGSAARASNATAPEAMIVRSNLMRSPVLHSNATLPDVDEDHDSRSRSEYPQAEVQAAAARLRRALSRLRPGKPLSLCRGRGLHSPRLAVRGFAEAP